MESAEADARVKGHNLHYYLTQPRAHLQTLVALLGPGEDRAEVSARVVRV